MDAERSQSGCPNCERLQQRVAELETIVRSLSDQVARLAAALEEERRRGKRQALPFSQAKDEPTLLSRKRRDASRVGGTGRMPIAAFRRGLTKPTKVPLLPAQCPHCGVPARERNARKTHNNIRPKFPAPSSIAGSTWHVTRAISCGQTVQGRHALQTSTACGAAASQLGPQRPCRAGDPEQATRPVAWQVREAAGDVVRRDSRSPAAPSARSIGVRPSVANRPMSNCDKTFAVRRRPCPTRPAGAWPVGRLGCTRSSVNGKRVM